MCYEVLLILVPFCSQIFLPLNLALQKCSLYSGERSVPLGALVLIGAHLLQTTCYGWSKYKVYINNSHPLQWCSDVKQINKQKHYSSLENNNIFNTCILMCLAYLNLGWILSLLGQCLCCHNSVHIVYKIIESITILSASLVVDCKSWTLRWDSLVPLGV